MDTFKVTYSYYDGESEEHQQEREVHKLIFLRDNVSSATVTRTLHPGERALLLNPECMVSVLVEAAGGMEAAAE